MQPMRAAIAISKVVRMADGCMRKNFERSKTAACWCKRPASSAQAYVTIRKGNKKLAVYDLTLVLSWAGRWEVDGKEVPPAAEPGGGARGTVCGALRQEVAHMLLQGARDSFKGDLVAKSLGGMLPGLPACQCGGEECLCKGLVDALSRGGAWPSAPRRVSQAKGEIRVAEFALANEPEEYEFACTADAASGSADAQVRLGALPCPRLMLSCLYTSCLPLLCQHGVCRGRGVLPGLQHARTERHYKYSSTHTQSRATGNRMSEECAFRSAHAGKPAGRDGGAARQAVRAAGAVCGRAGAAVMPIARLRISARVS